MGNCMRYSDFLFRTLSRKGDKNSKALGFILRDVMESKWEHSGMGVYIYIYM